MSHVEFLALLALAVVGVGLQAALLWQRRGGGAGAASLQQLQQWQQNSLERIDRVEREVRMQLQASAQATRQEFGAALAQSPDLLAVALHHRPAAILLSFGDVAPFAAAIARALLPASSSTSRPGPTKVMPASAHACARSGFSDRNP